MSGTAFDVYLSSLAGSWEALAVPHPDATLLRAEGFVAARFPSQPVFNNAVVCDPMAVPSVRALYTGLAAYAMWALDTDDRVKGALEAAGMRPDIQTQAMVCDLSAVVAADDVVSKNVPPDIVDVVTDADPGRIAELNNLPAELLKGVPGLRAFATRDYESGLVVIPVGTDVNVSFVMTEPKHRRRGLADAVTRAALIDARSRGFRTASLQATDSAEGVYARIGFVPLGRWQEWVPAA